MKHNEHVMAWLVALRDEATCPESTIERIIEIAGVLARYASGPSSV